MCLFPAAFDIELSVLFRNIHHLLQEFKFISSRCYMRHPFKEKLDMGRFYGKMLCEIGLGWYTGNIDLQIWLEMAFQREKRRIMWAKLVCQKWHSPAMESKGKKQANMPKEDRKWENNRKEEITAERALVQILNLQNCRNTGWNHYPSDPIWGKQLRFLAKGGYPSQTAGCYN